MNHSYNESDLADDADCYFPSDEVPEPPKFISDSWAEAEAAVASGLLKESDDYSNEEYFDVLPEAAINKPNIAPAQNAVSIIEALPHLSSDAPTAKVQEKGIQQGGENPDKDKDKDKDKKKEKEDPFVTARVLCPADDTDWKPREELVQGLLLKGEKAILYGSSNSGKTFCALELAACIADGERFFGRRVASGPVLYCAAESPESVRMRCQALIKWKNYKLKNLFLLRVPIDMYNNDDSALLIADTAMQVKKLCDNKAPALIVFDTLAQISAGAPENSNADMNLVLSRVGFVRQLLDESCTALIIHHVGKNKNGNGNGNVSERGASAIRGDVDSSLYLSEVEGSHGIITLDAPKMRDRMKGSQDIAFRLAVRDMGETNFSRCTTCTLEQTECPQSEEDSQTKKLDEEVTLLVAEVSRRNNENLEPLSASRACQTAFGWGAARGARTVQTAIDRGLLIRQNKEKGKGEVLLLAEQPCGAVEEKSTEEDKWNPEVCF